MALKLHLQIKNIIFQSERPKEVCLPGNQSSLQCGIENQFTILNLRASDQAVREPLSQSYATEHNFILPTAAGGCPTPVAVSFSGCFSLSHFSVWSFSDLIFGRSFSPFSCLPDMDEARTGIAHSHLHQILLSVTIRTCAFNVDKLVLCSRF